MSEPCGSHRACGSRQLGWLEYAVTFVKGQNFVYLRKMALKRQSIASAGNGHEESQGVREVDESRPDSRRSSDLLGRKDSLQGN